MTLQLHDRQSEKLYYDLYLTRISPFTLFWIAIMTLSIFGGWVYAKCL